MVAELANRPAILSIVVAPPKQEKPLNDDQQPFTAEERIAWESLYRTIQDAYKIATGNASHFKEMRWHKDGDPQQILLTARSHLIAWIDSDAFAFYAWIHGWNPDKAVDGIWAIINHEANLEAVKEMLQEIWRIRNRRSRDQETSYSRNWTGLANG